MTRSTIVAATAVTLSVLPGGPAAHAHAIAGARVFPVTLTIDDPGVADEASIPTFSFQRQPNDPDTGHGYQYNLAAEFDKRITEHLGHRHQRRLHGADGSSATRRARGSRTSTSPLKYQAWVNGPHEAIVSLGVIREFGRTGTAHTGADQYGSTTPTVYFGKGFGDLPVPALRPFAITGTIGYTIADKKLKAIDGGTRTSAPTARAASPALAAQQFNTGNSNRWVGGLSLQYSLPYLRSQVRDLGLPGFVNRLTPLVEVAYSSPASAPSNLGTQVVVAPGVIYGGDSFQVGVEALIPANRASGRFVGSDHADARVLRRSIPKQPRQAAVQLLIRSDAMHTSLRACAAMLLLLAPSLAFAHAQLRQADPPVGASSTAPPAQVELTFSEAVEPRFSTVTVERRRRRAGRQARPARDAWRCQAPRRQPRRCCRPASTRSCGTRPRWTPTRPRARFTFTVAP